MNSDKHIYGGLGFASGSDLRLQKIRQTVQFSLKKLGYTARISVDLTARRIQFSADAFSITLEISEPLPGSGTYSIDAKTRWQDNNGADPEDLALCVGIRLADCTANDPEMLLASLMIDLVRAHRPICIEWLNPKAQMRSGDFLAVFDIDQTGPIIRPRHPIRRKAARRFASVRAAVRANQTGPTPSGHPDVPLTKGLGWPDAQVALAEAYRLPLVTEGSTRTNQPTSLFGRTAVKVGSAFGGALSSPSALKQTVIDLFRREIFSLRH